MTFTGPYFLFFCRGFKLVGPMVIMVYRMLAQVGRGFFKLVGPILVILERKS